jgi:hypothetical protein
MATIHHDDPSGVRILAQQLTSQGQLQVRVQTPDLGTDNQAKLHLWDKNGHVHDEPLNYVPGAPSGNDTFTGAVDVHGLKSKGFDLGSLHAKPFVTYNHDSEAAWGAESFLGSTVGPAIVYGGNGPGSAPPAWQPMGGTTLPALSPDLAEAAATPYAPDPNWFSDKWIAGLDEPKVVDGKSLQLNDIGREDEGAVFLVGGDLVAGQTARVTAIKHPSNGLGSEVMLQLLPKASRELEQRLLAKGIAKDPAVIDDAGYDRAARVSLVGSTQPLAPKGYGSSNPTTAFRFEKPGAYVLEYLGEQEVPKAYRGAIRLRAYGASNEERIENIKSAVAAIGLEPLLKPPDPTFTKKVVAHAVLRHASATVADDVLGRLAELPLSEILQKAASVGTSAARIEGAAVKEVFPGHVAVIDPLLGDEYAKHGVKGVFVGIRDFESVARILRSDGLMAYAERTGRGYFRPGSSNQQDELSGGARAAFARAVTPRAYETDSLLQHSYAAGKVQLLTTGPAMRRLLSRTDWYGFPSDNFGVTITQAEASAESALANHSRSAAYSRRPVGRALVDAINGNDKPSSPYAIPSFQANNELCFDSGVGNVWTHAIVSDVYSRDALIATLQSVGIKDLNGLPFEKAIIVAQSWKQVRAQLLTQGVSDWAGGSPAPPVPPSQ